MNRVFNIPKLYKLSNKIIDFLNPFNKVVEYHPCGFKEKEYHFIPGIFVKSYDSKYYEFKELQYLTKKEIELFDLGETIDILKKTKDS